MLQQLKLQKKAQEIWSLEFCDKSSELLPHLSMGGYLKKCVFFLSAHASKAIIQEILPPFKHIIYLLVYSLGVNEEKE